MANITDPQVLKWLAEEVRPMAERLRDVLIKLETMSDTWTNQMQALVASYVAGDVLEDGRPELRQVTKGDLSALLSELATTLAQYPDLDVLRKFEVRAPEV